MTPTMPTSVRHVDHRAQQPGSDEALNGVDVAGDAADQVAGLFVVVVGERQPLDVGIERAPQVVHHPLADAGGQIFLGVRTDRSDDGDHQRRDRSQLQNSEAAVARRGKQGLAVPFTEHVQNRWPRRRRRSRRQRR